MYVFLLKHKKKRCIKFGKFIPTYNFARGDETEFLLTLIKTSKIKAIDATCFVISDIKRDINRHDISGRAVDCKRKNARSPW